MTFSPSEKSTLLSAIAYLESMERRAGYMLRDEDGRDISFACTYRSEDGPCVIGHLIPDHLYSEKLEGEGLNPRSPVWAVLRKAFPSHSTVFFEELSELQSIHDNSWNWGPEGFQPYAAASTHLENLKARLNHPLDNSEGF